MAITTFSFPTTIHFGPGARSLVAANLKSQGLSRPLVVTDAGVVKLPIHADLVALLSGNGLQVATFSGVWGNPVKSQVTAGVEAYRAHRADSIVGLGGGAALDVAKAVALMVDHPGDLFDYEDDLPGARPFDRHIPYWVALPTTAGTGSEVGRSSVIADDQTHIKKIIFSPRLLAKVVYADPELTTALPAKITADTGFDALTHCVEAFLAKNFHPICDGIALEGIRLAAGSLARCVSNPNDIDARGSMLLSSMMGAIAFQKGLGLTHSCAHALGTVLDFHHGFANAAMIDHALRFNAPAAPDRFARMAVTAGLSDATAEGFLGWLADLKKAVGVPATLGAAGVAADKVEALAELAYKDSCHGNNPRPVTHDDFRRIFTEAL